MNKKNIILITISIIAIFYLGIVNSSRIVSAYYYMKAKSYLIKYSIGPAINMRNKNSAEYKNAANIIQKANNSYYLSIKSRNNNKYINDYIEFIDLHIANKLRYYKRLEVLAPNNLNIQKAIGDEYFYSDDYNHTLNYYERIMSTDKYYAVNNNVDRDICLIYFKRCNWERVQKHKIYCESYFNAKRKKGYAKTDCKYEIQRNTKMQKMQGQIPY